MNKKFPDEIKNCFYCEYLIEGRSDFLYYRCKIVQRIIYHPLKIPGWCELEDV